MSKNKIEVKQIMETTEVIAYLEELLSCFKAGKIVVERGPDMISMDLPGTVKVEIGAKQKEDKGGFSLELEWKSETPETLEPMKISQCEPVVSGEETVPDPGSVPGEAGHLTAKQESAPVATGSIDDVIGREPSFPAKSDKPHSQEADRTLNTSPEPIPMPAEQEASGSGVENTAPETPAAETSTETEPTDSAKKTAPKAPPKKTTAKKKSAAKPAAQKKPAS